MSSLRGLWLIPLCLLAVGCSPDIKQVADEMVTDDFLKKGNQVMAIPFFEKGGHYFDDDASTKVDREIVLPLLQKLDTISHTPQWVVPDERDPKRAFAVLIELPSDNSVVDTMAKAVEEADAKFDQRGRRVEKDTDFGDNVIIVNQDLIEDQSDDEAGDSIPVKSQRTLL